MNLTDCCGVDVDGIEGAADTGICPACGEHCETVSIEDGNNGGGEMNGETRDELHRTVRNAAAEIQRQHRKIIEQHIEILKLRAECAQLRAEPRYLNGWLRRRVKGGVK
jgi:uncharacterized Zn finger protein (UPF0148 family)